MLTTFKYNCVRQNTYTQMLVLTGQEGKENEKEVISCKTVPLQQQQQQQYRTVDSKRNWTSVKMHPYYAECATAQ